MAKSGSLSETLPRAQVAADDNSALKVVKLEKPLLNQTFRAFECD